MFEALEYSLVFIPGTYLLGFVYAGILMLTFSISNKFFFPWKRNETKKS